MVTGNSQSSESNRKTRGFFAAFAVVASAALTIGFFLGRGESHSATADNAVSPRADSARAVVRPAPAATTTEHARVASAPTATSRPLPPPVTPIVTTIDELATRANRGEIAAAKRLYRDLTRCARRSVEAGMLQGMTQSLDDRRDDDPDFEKRRAGVAERRAHLESTDRICADVGDAQIEARGDWLERAAELGDAKSQTCYAMGPNQWEPRFLSDAWFDAARRWRERAPTFGARALAQGEPSALYLFVEGYAPRPLDRGYRYTISAFGELVTPDPELFYVYALLLERTSAPGSNENARVARARNALTAEQASRAQAYADREMPRFVGKPAATFPCWNELDDE